MSTDTTLGGKYTPGESANDTGDQVLSGLGQAVTDLGTFGLGDSLIEKSDTEKRIEAQENTEKWVEKWLRDNDATLYKGFQADVGTMTAQQKVNHELQQQAHARAKRFKAFGIDSREGDYYRVSADGMALTEKFTTPGLQGNFYDGFRAGNKLLSNWVYDEDNGLWVPYDQNYKSDASMVVTDRDIPHLLGLGGDGTMLHYMQRGAAANGGILNAASLAAVMSRDDDPHAWRRGNKYDALVPTASMMLAMNPTWMTDDERTLLRNSVRLELEPIINAQKEVFAKKMAAEGNVGATDADRDKYIAKYLHDQHYDVAGVAPTAAELEAYTATRLAKWEKYFGNDPNPAIDQQTFMSAGRTATDLSKYVYTPEAGTSFLESLLTSTKNEPLIVRPSRKPTTNNFFEAYGNTTIHHAH